MSERKKKQKESAKKGSIATAFTPWCHTQRLVAKNGALITLASSRLMQSEYFRILLNGEWMGPYNSEGDICTQTEEDELALLARQLHQLCIGPIDSTTQRARDMDVALHFYGINAVPTLFETTRSVRAPPPPCVRGFANVANDRCVGAVSIKGREYIVDLYDFRRADLFSFEIESQSGKPKWRPSQLIFVIGPGSAANAALHLHGSCVHLYLLDDLPGQYTWFEEPNLRRDEPAYARKILSLGIGAELLAVGTGRAHRGADPKITVYSLQQLSEACRRGMAPAPVRVIDAAACPINNTTVPKYLGVWGTWVSHNSTLPLHRGHSVCFLDTASGDIVGCVQDGYFTSSGRLQHYHGWGQTHKFRETAEDGVVTEYKFAEPNKAGVYRLLTCGRGCAFFHYYDPELATESDSDSSDCGSDSEVDRAEMLVVLEIATGRRRTLFSIRKGCEFECGVEVVSHGFFYVAADFVHYFPL